MIAAMTQFDSQKAEAFSSRLMGHLNSGALCLMASIGHRTGLFDAMRDQPPQTSEALARRAGLNERYVREWLGAMVTSGVVDVDPATVTFRLPPEHAAFLTRAAGADNIGVFTQYVALLGSVEDDIVDCFKKGGGVPYERFPRFHDVMAEDSGQSVMSSLESHIVPLVPELSERLAEGARWLDLGCGRGMIIARLAELYPKSTFVGLDPSTDAIEWAQNNCNSKKIRNVEFVVRDLSDFDESADKDAYDFVSTFDAVHDQAQPLRMLRGIHRTLKRDGVYLMQDIKGSSFVRNNLGHPLGPMLYTVSCMHCMTVSLAQSGEGLGAMWGEEKTRDYLAKAGFGSVRKHELAHDIQNNWYVVQK
jgi:ubiquinone/menaquinone biosynthesis C-methylase UbiE